MKKLFMALSAATFLCLLAFPVQAARLDGHDGMMKITSANIMAYQNSNLTGQLNHYIVAGDWYNIIASGSGSVQLHYPITIANGKGDATETHYFNYADWAANCDGAAGTFSEGWDQTAWYNAIPRSGVTYTDNCPDNNPVLYVSNNTGYSIIKGLYNNELWCGAVKVLKPTSIPATYCYYDHSDYTDADWGWVQKSQAWSTTGLIQGTNTVYCAGSDASGNYATANYTFKFDNVAPYCTSTAIKNVTSTGYDVYVYGVADATSGVKKVMVPTWTTPNQSNIQWLQATSQGSGTYMCHVSASSFGGATKGYTSDVYIYDNAGNWGRYHTNTSNLTPPSGNPSYYPTADFEATSPVLLSQTITYTDLSTSGSSSDNIDQEQWSYSSDGQSTWSSDTSSPPSFFLSTGTYYVRLRVHDKTANIWSDYCVREIDVISVTSKPTASFLSTSPVATNAFIKYVDQSHVDPSASTWDSITQEEWSYSTDNGQTWSAPTGFPQLTFDLSEFPASTLYATYEVRLRVKDAGNEYSPGVWSDYCIQPIIVYRPNTPPSALFTVNTAYSGYDFADKTVSHVFSGYDYDGSVITYIQQNNTIQCLPDNDDVPVGCPEFASAKKIVINNGYIYALMPDGTVSARYTKNGTVYQQSISNVTDIAARGACAYAVSQNGTILMQQDNTPANISTSSWTTLFTINNVIKIDIDSADGAAFALQQNGTLVYWYDYNYPSAFPARFVPITVCTGVKDMSAGGIGLSGYSPFYHGVVELRTDNTIVCQNFDRSHSSYSTFLGMYCISTAGLPTIAHIYAGQYLYLVTEGGDVYSFNNVYMNSSDDPAGVQMNTCPYDTYMDGSGNEVSLANGTGADKQIANSNTLTKILGLNNVTELTVDYSDSNYTENDSIYSANFGTAYAVGQSGVVKQWGYDPQTNQNNLVASDLPYYSTFYPISVSAGGASVTVKMSDGSFQSFGDNSSSELGYTNPIQIYSYTNFNSPVYYPQTAIFGQQYCGNYPINNYNIAGSHWFKNIQSVSHLGSTTFLFTDDGKVYEQGNRYLFANGVKVDDIYPTDLQVNNPVKIVPAASSGDFLLLMPDGTVMAWGNGSYSEFSRYAAVPDCYMYGSQLFPYYTRYPNNISCVSSCVDIASAYGCNFVLFSDGTVKQLVYDSTANNFYLSSTGLTNVKAISSGNNTLLVQHANGDVSYYKNSETSLGLHNIVQMTGNANFAIALDANGNVYTWGSNSYGELGQGDFTSRSAPTQIAALQNIRSIAAGDTSAYAVSKYNNVYTWGDNSKGQLGVGNSVTQLALPTIIPKYSYNVEIPAIFPEDPVSISDDSSANDYWDSIAGNAWQWSWDNATWTTGKPSSFTMADLNGQRERLLYIREQVSDIGNPPYSSGLASKWFTLRVLLVDPRPQNGTLAVTKYNYMADASNYWIKANSQLGVYTDSNFPANLLFSPSRAFVGFGRNGTYDDGTSAMQYADVDGHYKSGDEYDTYFTLTDDGSCAISIGNELTAHQTIVGKKDATSFELYSNTSFLDSNSGKEYRSQEGYRNSGLWVHVDGRAPTGSAVITLANNTASTVVSNVTDNGGSGTKILYAEIYDNSSGAKTNLQTVNLTTSDGGSTWTLPATNTAAIGSMSNIEIDIYAEDNVGNVGMVGTFKNGSMTSGNLTGTLVLSSHYYENTDVTGAVNVAYTNTNQAADLIPSSGVTVQITAGSQVIAKTVLCPANNTSYIPFTFHTPSVPAGSSQPLTVSVQIDPDHVMPETDYADNNVSQQVTIDSAAYTEPPATTYQPEIPSTFQNISPGNYPSTNSFSWQEWRYENGALVLKTFSINVSSAMQLTPDSRIGSDKLGSDGIWTIRSGYGFGDTTTIHVTTNYDQPDLITLPQRIRVYFPEFNYDMQNNLRELEKGSQTGTASDYTVTYQFKQNSQSDILARLHFTPLWFPNGAYTVLENVRDLWTPAGQINMWGASQLNISGSVYDDWYTGLIKNQT